MVAVESGDGRNGGWAGTLHGHLEASMELGRGNRWKARGPLDHDEQTNCVNFLGTHREYVEQVVAGRRLLLRLGLLGPGDICAKGGEAYGSEGEGEDREYR